MKPSDFLTELSNEKLAQYKTAASADASKADSEGDFKKGNKRFSGIVKATKKQFANDEKKVEEGVGLPSPSTYEETNDMFKSSGQRRIGTLTTEDEQIDGMAQGEIREIIKNAVHIKNQLDKGVSLDGWMYSFVTVSNDKLNSVAEQINNPNIEEQGVAEGLNEGVGGNYLYHATGAVKLILQSGAINAAEGPQLATQAQTKLPTVSITRDWNYATGGKGSAATDHLGHDGIIILDRNAVESNFKTLGTSQSQTVRGLANPVDTDWGDKIKDRKAGTGGLDTNNDGNIDYKEIGNVAKSKMGDFGKKMISAKLNAPKAGGEFEEAVVVPKGSLPLKGTMVGFWVNPQSQLTKDPEVMNDPRRLELAPGGTGRFVKAQQTQGVAEEQHSCPHCGGEMVSEELMNEKKDACYYKVKSRYSVWPSAYASGALVKCRKKGASNWGNGGKKNESSILEGINQTDESLHDWFNKEKWVRMDTKGNIKGPCAKEPGEGKPKCLPQSKAHSLGKKGRASAAARKRREDPNPDRHGKAINVNTKKETKG